MQKYTTTLMLAALSGLLTTHVGAAAQAGAWEEDFRRCMIYKPIPGGRVVIANDEGVLEIDAQRDGDANEGTDTKTYMVAFDDRSPIDTTPPRNASAGVYDHRLGTYAAIAPMFAKARNMTISITAADKPADTIAVSIGDGTKAMAFLKKCDDYWRRYNNKHR
jgi:hypothetical protein